MVNSEPGKPVKLLEPLGWRVSETVSEPFVQRVP
jgi:hypothetical protein